MTEADKASYISTTDEDPFPFYEKHRPVGAVKWDEGLQAWLVLTYDLCKEVARVDDASYLMPERVAERREGTVKQLLGGARVIMQLEGEQHLKMHQWWLRAFSPRTVEL